MWNHQFWHYNFLKIAFRTIGDTIELFILASKFSAVNTSLFFFFFATIYHFLFLVFIRERLYNTTTMRYNSLMQNIIIVD